jgi:4-amino-4-deoxy-L-arabinose transferase-like glycosyltransferase
MNTQFSPKPHKSQIYIDSFLILIIIGAFYALFLGTYALFTPDGARYCEIAREMAASRDYITPHLNHVLYFEKPILFYWLQAASIHFLGLSEWAMRFWNAFFAVAGCLFTYIAGYKLFNRKTGLFAAFILATNLLYFSMGHLISLDMTVTFFITISLYSFILGTNTQNNSKRRLYMWLAAIAAALAVSTKGLIGIVLPLMIIGIWLLLLNEWRSVKKWFVPSSIIIFLLITLPWHILIQIKHPYFLHFYFIEQQLARYSSMIASRYDPFYYFIGILIIGFFPWILFLCQALYKTWPKWSERKQYKTEIFLLIWFIAIFLFFSFSESKLIPYILPIFPPLALMTGRYFALLGKNKTIGLKIGFILLPVIAFLLCIYFILLPHYYKLSDPTISRYYLYALAFIIFLTATISSLVFWKYQFKQAFIVLNIGMMLFLATMVCAIPYLNHRSIKPLAMQIKQDIKPTDEVITYHRYYQDLPFYLTRRVSIVGWENELKFGKQHQDTSAWLYNDNTFWQKWNSNKHVFVITENRDYKKMMQEYPKTKIYKLGQLNDNVLLSNKESGK